ncbi:23S rRNA (uridine(2552)-2'-O-)-methyltransferase [Allomyces macrogynus ATCC 38327]|uniref:23S rRNA (Uridine(2552)-2'-O-)-methyltransferase n=1 Tax=Allomyces macrogynus (strain ATCC 38327) TaxID=578462 RepID=A0A0L0S9I2_ALLM3|nr:23S rRNA (uridine(2552)-2'-O-)-methyltransferase [Allomyces macrogynus ATCC 38327]|eukprot:KNE59050.1 23S rRNA (uridine(2552)-2'-O-)-methyltransferase [Allomyces macrogynus ATCC 38327]
MGKKGKTGKGRLDKYYHLAKEQGFRSRAAFKLVQLNKKYNFLEKARVLIDLCAAPGGWLQVASKYMLAQSLILGVDLVPIKPIPRVITFASDITTDKCRAELRGEMKTWKADVVLHDGAPNVGTAWVQDAYSQSELVLHSLKLATEFLAKGGTFVTKVFRSKDYNSLLWVFNQLFENVEATKPPSSRNVSAEIFVVCRDFKAPKKIDPKFLDPRHVFDEVEEQTVTHLTSVFQPEKKKRQREGYGDGDYTLFHTTTISQFLQSPDPVGILAANNTIEFASDADRALLAHELTTDEIKTCFADLKVLGKKDFKALLKWRVAMRVHLGLEVPKEQAQADAAAAKAAKAAAEEEELDDEERMARELDALAKEDRVRAKRTKRKLREKRARELLRMQLNMTAPTDVGTEQQGEDALFDGGANATRALVEVQGLSESDSSDGDESDYDMDEAGVVLDDDVAPKLSGRAAMFFSNPMFASIFEEERVKKTAGSGKSTKAAAAAPAGGKASKRAAAIIESDVDMDGSDDEDDDYLDVYNRELEEQSASRKRKRQEEKIARTLASDDEDDGARHHDSDDDSDVEQPAAKSRRTEAMAASDTSDDSDSDNDVEAMDDDDDAAFSDVDLDGTTGPPEGALTTPHALALAHMVKQNKHAVVDASFNRYAYADNADLPAWFLEDERKFNKPVMPVSKETVEAIMERRRALDARPIKKVAEAKYRKKKRAVAKLTRLVKKAASIAEAEDMTESAKATAVSKLLSKKVAKQHEKPKLVVARGTNRGVKGRPGGVKGRYKMVDSRMKKELRATKRIGDKAKGKKRK